MAFPTSLPGHGTGIVAKRISSMNERAIGKLTDTNHLSALGKNVAPAKYDKDIISLYTQTSTSVSDFQQMLMKADPYEIPKGSPDYWMWEVPTVFKFPKIVAVPDTTRTNANAGIDQQIFEFVMDKEAFFKNQVITADNRYAQRFFLVADPEPFGTAFLYKAILVSQNPLTDVVDKRWLAEGTEYQLERTLIGEFTQDAPGLPGMGDKIHLYESLGAGAAREHTVTGWAEERNIPDSADIIMYAKMERNEQGYRVKERTWEPMIERLLREDLLKEGMHSAIWGTGGIVRERGSKQELLKYNAGLYHRIRNNGNLHQYPRGGFSINMLRQIFGDLFYRRVPMGQRRVKLYTNEAGFDVFGDAVKEDAQMSGVTFMDDGSGKGFIEGTGQSRMLNFGFDSVWTRETGVTSLIHLAELDEFQTNNNLGQNRKSTPVFLVFDVSPTSDGSLTNNIRMVKRAGTPLLRWGYTDGKMSHLGPMASQGFQQANSFDGYKIDMMTRNDVFIEDLSRCVLIEELPLY